MLETALCLPVFLLALFGAIDSALWCVQTSAAVATAEAGVRIAAAANGSPTAASTSIVTSQEVYNDIGGNLRSAMFGTTVLAWPHAGCPSSWSGLPDRTIYICVRSLGTTGSGQTRVTMVECEVIGYAASVVPVSFGLGFHSGEIPIKVGAESSSLAFAP